MPEILLHQELDQQRREIATLAQLLEERALTLYAARQHFDATDRLLGSVLGTLRSAVFVVDPDGRIVRTNGAAAALLGVPAEAVHGRELATLFAADSVPVGGGAGEVELLGAGGRVPVRLASSPLVDEHDLPTGRVCIADDLRQQKRLELELRHAQKLESVGQLAAGVAHEINTPVQFVGDSIAFLGEAFAGLRTLLGAYRRLRTAAADEPALAALADAVAEAESAADLDFLLAETPAAIDRAGEGVARIATIVKAVKAFAHPGDAVLAPADLNEAIRTTLEVCRNEYKYVAEVALELGDLPLVDCTIGDINQVVLNLVVNAAHAIEEQVGGSGRRGHITIRSRVDGTDAVIEVADTGGGIPDHVVGRIFDPFFTTKPVGKGTGQGLPIARTIVVDRHGGELTFETTSGRGSTFRVRLPIRADGGTQR